MFRNSKIETERLIIRPYILEDTKRIFDIVSEKDFFKCILKVVPSLDEVRKIIQWSINCCENKTPEKIYKFNN